MNVDLKLMKEYAFSFIGLPYIWGGDDPIIGFDCSGLVQEILAAGGLDPAGDQTAQGLYNYFSKNGSYNVRDLGSLAFYGKSHLNITHIAWCLDPHIMIEAGGGGSLTTSAQVAAQKNAFVRLRPIEHRKDLVACIMPLYGPVVKK